MTFFISCSPRIAESFASLGPDCLFYCNRSLEAYFLWSLVSFLFWSSWSLLFKASSSKKAADPFLECSRFVVCSCFLPKVFETGLKLEGGTTKLVFCEAGGVIVGSGVPGGGFQIPTPKFRRPSKIVPNLTRLWKLFKLLNLGRQHPKMFGKKVVKF